MNLNQDHLDLITDLCDFADTVGTVEPKHVEAVKQLRKFVALNTWYGPYNNPFKAYLNCANGNNIDTSEVMQFVIPGWLSEWEIRKEMADTLLEDLLSSLHDYTGVLVLYRVEPITVKGGWYANLSKEVK